MAPPLKINPVETQAKELATLQTLAGALARSLSLPEILGTVLEKIVEVLELEGAGIYLQDETSGALQLAAQAGNGWESAAQSEAGLAIAKRAAQVVASGKPWHSQVASQATRPAPQLVALVPIGRESQISGALAGIWRGGYETGEADLELLARLGSQVGTAVANTRLQAGALEKLAQLAALQETSRAVVSTLELNALLNLIVQHATRLMRAEGGILNLANLPAGVDEVVATAGSTAEFLGVRYSLEKSLSGWATLHNQPVISNQIQADPRVAHVYTDLIHTRLKNAVAAPLNHKGQVLGSLVIVDKAGGKRDFSQDDLELLVAFANQAAAAIENARLFRAEQRRAEQFRVIGEVVQHISSAVEVDRLVEQMARLIQQAFGYEHVGIGLIEKEEVVSKAEIGAYATAYHERRFKLGEGHWGWVAAHGEARLASDVAGEGDLHPTSHAAGVRAYLCVPLKSKDAVLGVLSATSDRPNAFDESDLIVFQSLAHQAAVAVENIRYYERAQHLAVMEERNRLARELHDAVTQTIFSASLLAEALPEVWASDPQQGLQLLQEFRSLSRGALAEMRTLLLELRPAALAEARLEDLLRQLGEAASGREGIPVSVTIEGQGTSPSEVHIALYRIAQEALNNVVKHAQASQVSVRLCYTCTERTGPDQPAGSSVLLIIRDDGCGFELEQVPPERLGLGIMAERAHDIGASLSIESQPGEGTQVTVLWEAQPSQLASQEE